MRIFFALVTAALMYSADSVGQTLTNPIKSCDDAPNCVSSKGVNPKRTIQPIIFYGGKSEFKHFATAIIQAMPRSKIVTADDNYIHAEFTSSMLKFVDDFELYYDESKKMIEMRSAARVGYYDFGVNLKRCKDFEIEFLKNTKK